MRAGSAGQTQAGGHAAQVDRAPAPQVGGRRHRRAPGDFHDENLTQLVLACATEDQPTTNRRPTDDQPTTSSSAANTSCRFGTPVARRRSTPLRSSSSVVGVLATFSRRTRSSCDSASTSTARTPGTRSATSCSTCRTATQGRQNALEKCTSVARSPSASVRRSPAVSRGASSAGGRRSRPERRRRTTPKSVARARTRSNAANPTPDTCPPPEEPSCGDNFGRLSRIPLPETCGCVSTSRRAGALDRRTAVVAFGQVTVGQPGSVAFTDAYPRLFHDAYRVAYRLLGDRTEAEDVAAETCA